MNSKLLAAAHALPIPVMVVSSLWFVHPDLLKLLGTVLCVVIFVIVVFSRSVRMMLVGTTVIAVILSIATSNWPLMAAFNSSRHELERIAKEVRSGNAPSSTVTAGFFRIRKAEVAYNGVVCLWTNPNSSGNSGFVRFPRDNPPFNLWSHFRLDDNWQFITED